MRVCSDEFSQWTKASSNPNGLPFRYSTEGVAPQDRAAAWREVLSRVYVPLDVTAPDDDALKATIEQHLCSSLSLCFIEIETSAVSLSRTPELIADDDCDFQLLFVDGSQFEFISDRTGESMRDGDAVLLSGTKPCTVRCQGPCRVTAIRLPRQDLMAAARDLKDCAVHRLESGMALRFIANHVGSLRKDGPTDDPVLAHRLANHLIELVALALGPQRAHSRPPEPAAAIRKTRFAAIQADVLANLSRVGLSAKMIAQRHGITDRYVHLLFEETGQTFSRFVQEERLKRAFTLLTDPDRAQLQISEVAFESGFTDISTFNRAFRRRFGGRPRDVRAALKSAWTDPKKVVSTPRTRLFNGEVRAPIGLQESYEPRLRERSPV